MNKLIYHANFDCISITLITNDCSSVYLLFRKHSVGLSFMINIVEMLRQSGVYNMLSKTK